MTTATEAFADTVELDRPMVTFHFVSPETAAPRARASTTPPAP